jgi:hypothetical protein
VLHALSYLSSKGRAAIVCFPGIFYRGGAEKKIRKYLIDNDYVETINSLAPIELGNINHFAGVFSIYIATDRLGILVISNLLKGHGLGNVFDVFLVIE